MGKIPYTQEYQLFHRCDFKHAEDILAEYNDFYIYNLAHQNELCGGKIEHDNNGQVQDDIDEAKRLKIIEHNKKVATEHFASLFGSKDFGESAMLGFHPSWYDLQQILIEEYKHKTPITQSVMNNIAPILRNAATVLLYAERIVTSLEKLNAHPDIIMTIKQGFEVLLEQCKEKNLGLPEFNKNKANLAKYKKVEQYIDFCGTLFNKVK